MPLQRLFGMAPLIAAIAMGAGSALLLGGAWWFELWMGLKPCKLCLEQRLPHYVALPLAAFAVIGIFQGRRMLTLFAMLALVLTYVISAGLGYYHAGVEWGWFAGPNDCAGTPAAQAPSMSDFMRQLETTRVVSCTEAAWRMLGLSLAGWNMLASLALAWVALQGMRALAKRP